MTDQLLSMKVRESRQFNEEDYAVIRSTANRLKRDGKGQWQTAKGGFKGERTLTVKRTA